jgi:signal peptidase II
MSAPDTTAPTPANPSAGRIGLILALLALALDQLSKWWILHVYRLGERGRVEVTPFFDLVMLWNTGISYGLFPQQSDLGRYGLIGFSLLVSVVLLVWMLRSGSIMVAAALGLIVGGAIGNAIDRIAYGAVADFISLHGFGFYWYVFNVADMAIVAGVGLLILDMVRPGHKIDAKFAETIQANESKDSAHGSHRAKN